MFQTKCIMEDVNDQEEVTGSFRAFAKDHPEQAVTIDARVGAWMGAGGVLGGCWGVSGCWWRHHPEPPVTIDAQVGAWMGAGWVLAGRWVMLEGPPRAGCDDRCTCRCVDECLDGCWVGAGGQVGDAGRTTPSRR